MFSGQEIIGGLWQRITLPIMVGWLPPILSCIVSICLFQPVAANAADANAEYDTALGDKRCFIFGPGLTYYEELNMCAGLNGSLFVYVEGDFAHTDIEMEGVRLPALPSFAPIEPLQLYYEKDVTDDTKHPEIGGGLTVNAPFGWDTEYGPVSGLISLGAYSNGGELSDWDDTWDDMWESSNLAGDHGEWYGYPGGVVQQAWLKFGRFSFGIQKSKFDNTRTGYSPFPGYAISNNVASIAYTDRIDENTSFSFALEDPEPRYRADGVLAAYDHDGFWPDIVFLGRKRYKNMLFHTSVAIRDINEGISDIFPIEGSDNQSPYHNLGYAINVGTEFNWGWQNDKSTKADDQFLRFMVSGTYANGATGYLGVPFFAPDFVVAGNGDIENSEGVSGFASAEYIWSPTFKTAITGSGYHVRSGSKLDLAPNDPIIPALNWNVWTQGAKLQLSAEQAFNPNFRMGCEFAYEWTRAWGDLGGEDLGTVSSSFPSVKVYATVNF